MKRFEQILLVASFLAFSWLAMQVVHELGHVVGAYMTGAKVERVVLHPWSISRTDLGSNLRPGVVAWAGPLLGALLPLLIFLVAKVCRTPGIYLVRFFAAFCLIANGAYIALGPADGLLDSTVMAQAGTPRAAMLLFGLFTVPVGLYLMHGQGEHFGLGEAKGKVSRSAVVVSIALLITLVGIELILYSMQ